VIPGRDIADLMERDLMQERINRVDRFLDEFTWPHPPPTTRIRVGKKDDG
jgi:hypothetical protein